MLNLKCLYPQSPERQGHSHSLPGPSVLLGPCLFLLVTEGPVLTSSHQTPLELPLSGHCGHCPLFRLLHQVSCSPSTGLSSPFTVPFNVAIFRNLCQIFLATPSLGTSRPMSVNHPAPIGNSQIRSSGLLSPVALWASLRGRLQASLIPHARMKTQ